MDAMTFEDMKYHELVRDIIHNPKGVRDGIEVIVEKCLIIMFLMLIHLENDIFTTWLLINQWK